MIKNNVYRIVKEKMKKLWRLTSNVLLDQVENIIANNENNEKALIEQLKEDVKNENDDEQKEKDIYVLSEVADFYFLSNPIPPEEFSAHCDELGYVKDYKNLHFYTPDTYESEHVYICNKGSGYAAILSDNNLSGHDYSVLETKHYLTQSHRLRNLTLNLQTCLGKTSKEPKKRLENIY